MDITGIAFTDQPEEGIVPKNNKLARFNPADLAELRKTAKKLFQTHQDAGEYDQVDKYSLFIRQINDLLVEEVNKLID